MKFVLKPSLAHIALVKIAVSLWNQNNVRTLILMADLRFYWDFSSASEKWMNILRKVAENVEHLSLPEPLKDNLIAVCIAIGSKILKWLSFHHRYLRIQLPAEFCWTSQGTIDGKKTAEILIKDESFDISTRYKLACFYCLEKDIHEFWKVMPIDSKKSHLDTTVPSMCNFWSSDITKSSANFSNKFKFEYCAKVGNEVAAQYYLLKLTPSEREESLVETAKCVQDYNVLMFLLSEMNDEQQMEFFKTHFYIVLLVLLEFPWQSFFREAVSCMWDFLPQDYYLCILIDIIGNAGGCTDWPYQKLFTQFWQDMPNAARSYTTNRIHRCYGLLPRLCSLRDQENIRLILKDATLTVKEKLIYSDKIHNFCQRSIHDNEWDSLEFCIRECFPLKNEMLKFKEEAEKRIKWNSVEDDIERTKKHKWNQLFCLSDDSICKNDKRHTECGSVSSKRFRSLQ